MEEKKSEETRSVEITVQVEAPDCVIRDIVFWSISDAMDSEDGCEIELQDGTVLFDDETKEYIYEDCPRVDGCDGYDGYECIDTDWLHRAYDEVCEEACNILLTGGTLLVNGYELEMAGLLRRLQRWTKSALLNGHRGPFGKLTPIIRDGQYLLENFTVYDANDIVYGGMGDSDSEWEWADKPEKEPPEEEPQTEETYNPAREVPEPANEPGDQWDEDGDFPF